MVIRTVVINECKRLYDEMENIEKNLVELKAKFVKLSSDLTKDEFNMFREITGLVGDVE